MQVFLFFVGSRRDRTLQKQTNFTLAHISDSFFRE